MQTPSIQDSYQMTLNLMQGVEAFPGFDLENADFVLSFGSGIIDGWGSPVRMFKANSSWRENDGKVVQIEQRLSNTAAKSDQWLPINSGTEAALALGLANVIIKESLYNTYFVDNYATGFNEWKQLVLEKYSPEKVAAITGTDEKTIIDLARNFAGASTPLAICGRGRGTSPGSLNEFLAVHALNALAGNINNKGGVWAVPEPDYFSKLKLNAFGLKNERIDGAGSSKYPFTRSLLNRLPEAINSGKPYPMNALLITHANPLYSTPDTKTVKAAFDKIPFVVSFSSYMDETASNADLILPNHTYLERYEDVPVPAGLQKPIISLSKPLVQPLNTK